MWLEDAIIELWRDGTNIRDAVIVKKINEKATIMIHTPAGESDEITVHNIVKQGTVYGPQLCCSSMSKVNTSGKEITTNYGPTLIIRATQFVDDVSNAGSVRSTNNTIHNCRRLEDSKKMTFSNTNGKTEYTIVNPTKHDPPVTSKVKKGQVLRTKEHKSLGMWIDERGTYAINIEKNMKRIPHMIQTVKAIGSPRNIGTMALATRIKLVNTVIMPSLLYNIEVIPCLTKDEIK